VVGVGSAYAAYQLAGYSWDQVVSYKSPYLSEASPTAGPLAMSAQKPAPAVVDRVVLVIVDGLRDDVSRSAMSNLQTMRQYGADFTLIAPQPSLSYPNWTTILTGAPPEISGVTTNWYDTRVDAPTLMDAARLAGKRVAVVGPSDFATLYATAPGPDVVLRDWPKNGYLTKTLVDDALRLFKERDPELLVVHLPDVDEAGHSFGGASPKYAAVANKVDEDLKRLAQALPADGTAIIVTADHGQIDSGGHGGWEPDVIRVPFVMTGGPAVLSTGEGRLTQVAPTVSVLLGVPVPTFASDTALAQAMKLKSSAYSADRAHHAAFADHYVSVVTSGAGPLPSASAKSPYSGDPDTDIAIARAHRAAVERKGRLLIAAGLAAAALLALLAVFAASWRAGLSALAGVVAYYGIYNALFFWLHHYAWSLSAFNTEDMVGSFMNGRMIEALVSAIVAAKVAALVYPLLRREPKGARVRGYAGGWLALGPATVLAIQATLGLQIAWFLWAYGAAVTWALPNLKWGFKYDLDLVQATALGAAIVLSPLVTYLVGRYHPLVRKPAEK
jgi:hypothetical protein